MSLGRSLDVFGLGQCSLDYLGRISAFPEADAKCEFSDLVIEGGGPVATALVALARWGARCAFAGVLGDDPFAPSIRASLEREGVDTSGIVVRPETASQFAFIVAEPTRQRRTVFWRRPTGAALRPSELNLENIRRARVLHTDGYPAEATLAAAQDAGAIVVVDAGSLRDGMLELASVSDAFIASSAFARSLIGDDRPRDACRKLAEQGARVVGVTLGDKGYVALENGVFIERPAFITDTVDTTGCGDIFHAGFIHGLLHGWSTERSLEFGAWAAAMVSRKIGGREGIPKADDWPGPRSHSL